MKLQRYKYGDQLFFVTKRIIRQNIEAGGYIYDICFLCCLFSSERDYFFQLRVHIYYMIIK